jgi:hypothetical protein
MSFKVVQKNYTHYLNIDVPLDLEHQTEYNLVIVYFINCLVNNNYFDWLVNQMDLIKDFKGKIYVISTIKKEAELAFREKIAELYSNVTIECYYENEFEYRGILKVWELGKIYNKRHDIILYFHAKGTSHHPNYDYNRNDPYNIILKNIDLIKEIFSIFPPIDKIGYCSGGTGWIWYNFWYARGSYINLVEKPIKTLL